MYRIVLFIIFCIFFPNKNSAQVVRLASWNINTLSEISGKSILKNSVIRTDSDYDLLKKYAQEINADIVSLQEMGSYNAIKRIFPEDIWNILYAENDSGDSIHTAIVIRKEKIKIIEKNYISTTINENDIPVMGQRNAVELLFKVNGKKVWLLCVHLKSACHLDHLASYNKSCAILNKQAIWLNRWINKRKNENMPFIISGDFNRKINRYGEDDEFWQQISNNTNLIRFPYYKRSKCQANHYKNSEPIDFFIMNKLAYQYHVEGSFYEFSYRNQDIKERRYNLSDHCPIIIEYDF
ncbi:endonuclease/exonuclease/phosphatase family protein [Candidatus Liberibacter americanus]|uniref:Endonuclease/exonuclease/phosphatase domain-containing protein n=1 Tax=Candidatus Liberibacter americanus str. Sao Paulo TaxID=1261131 RepID=U6B4H6_9HYPH|nr:endonuclease/exonuclease/phosphatase family protein [Candidatus Liberibacter americanus]AHA27533.1 hypothetical protein lam_159 [Candidatus Liberibacter americanus str. Sao Paulo]EMS36506.1 hypothetical protein G653_01072 [Candidatus Liberibacter americanus PW_SP]